MFVFQLLFDQNNPSFLTLQFSLKQVLIDPQGNDPGMSISVGKDGGLFGIPSRDGNINARKYMIYENLLETNV